MRSKTVEQDNDAQDLAPPCNTSSPAQPAASTEPGTMHVDSQGTTYFASPHWETMMDEISDLKNDFRKAYEGEYLVEITDVSSRAMSTTPLLLYGSMQPISKEALISALPDRDIADRLIFRYFSEISILPARVVHPSTFLKQYEEFWTSQTAVSFSWLGLLYGVLSLSDLFSLGPEHRQSHPRQTYLQQLVRCLIAADYIRGGPYILESLIHYFLVEFYLNPVTEVGNWMVAGIIAQLAFRMGYHRDPSHFPHISPFEGEIRRRAWATVHILDSTMAMLVGAPRIISDGTWNTRPPGNIPDADLDHGCAQLAVPRADNEMTEVSFLLARYKMSLATGRLVDLSLTNKLESSEDVRNAESRLETTWVSMPESFKFTSLSHCLSDNSVSLAHRIMITSLYNKSRIILYQRQLRKFASKPRAVHEDWVSSAGHMCLEAALEIIKQLVFLDIESQPGGMLVTLRTKVSALVIHEGLVATAALSIYLYHCPRVPLDGENGCATKSPEVEMMLRRSYQTWSRWGKWSAEAKRATELLDSLFRKLGEGPLHVGLDETHLQMDDMELNLDWDADTLGVFFPLLDGTHD
ncbi:hypothetical protein CTAM01_10922 [Colletotrichum tamarilloi]|uniref:Xylanolytic transcriptional activator regulatory domain-containing protein n=1 Tax=Colletotrichum tamarilloi TaxID=1209934 RepID=A0ABQ9QZ29_9PEZI|nr:uncharacterized protein CTAM01_10922 [Colletotrichum tamarilloi]KAK1490072.1 hypothetical protein CTAM01_10922 [Colletotrichum tamarilloi]